MECGESNGEITVGPADLADADTLGCDHQSISSESIAPVIDIIKHIADNRIKHDQHRLREAIVRLASDQDQWGGFHIRRSTEQHDSEPDPAA